MTNQPSQPGHQWHDTGHTYRVDPDSPDRFDAEIQYAVKAGVHLWGAVVTYKIAENTLDALETGQADTAAPAIMLDQENRLNAPLIGCMVCEQPYSRRLRRRACAGEPKR